jgi:SAM-dependent methyltransferase
MTSVLTQIEESHNPKANEWVLSWLRRLAPGSKVLDFASGQGRHALAAVSLGLDAYAWDQDPGALEILAQMSAGQVHTLVHDLEAHAWPLQHGKFDAVVVSNYLFRPRLAFLGELLNEGGVLIYQTFAAGHETLGRPRRPDFLLNPGELFQRSHAMGLHVLSYQDSVMSSSAMHGMNGAVSIGLATPPHSQRVRDDDRPKSRVQRIVALKHSSDQATPEVLRAWPVNIQG